MATAAGGSGGIDRISSLPDNAREHILHFLPLRDAAKASLLSTTWRNMWMHLPTLVLDNKSFFQLATIDKLMFNICRVFLLHRGPLRELTLSGSFPDQLYQILMFLQDKRLEGLTVVDHIERYNLPSCLFSPSFSRHLKTLRLSGCQFPASSPVSFEGFSMLTVLELRNMNMIGEASSTTLWSFRCHLLSTLILDGFGGYSQKPPILIEAPRLEYFHFVGNFCYLHLSTPCLKHAIIHKGTTFLVDRKPYSILKTWYGLEAIESLSVSGHFCRYVAAARDKWWLLRHLRPWEILRHMTFNDMCLSRRGHVWSLLHIITNSPNLQRLAIQAVFLDVGELHRRTEDRNGVSKYELRRLEGVELKRLEGTPHDMTFVRWLLNSSPVLDEMEITLSTTLSANESTLILKELNGFQRPSNRARIIIH